MDKLPPPTPHHLGTFYPDISPRTALAGAAESHRKAFPVVAEDALEGLIETRALARVPRGEWGRHTVDEVMRRDLEAITVSPRTDAVEALGRMQRSGSSRRLVAEGNRLVGILSLKDLLRFLSLKIELEGCDESRPGPTSVRPETDGPIPTESFLASHR